MKTRASILALLLGLASLFPRLVSAALVNGQYQFAVELAPLCLDGEYPFIVGQIENASLRVSTDVRGRLTGQVDLRALKIAVTGRIVASRNALILTLRSSDPKMPFRVRATLQGNRFVGTARSKGIAACSMDVSAAAPLAVQYDLALTVDPRGRVSGTGTATACRQTIPVVASGLTKPNRSTLRVTGGNTTFMGAGKSKDGGFTAAWKAQAFGAAMKGENLSIQAE